MVTGLAVAALLVAGAPVWWVGAVGLAQVAPLPALAAVVGTIALIEIRRRPPDRTTSDEAAFLHGLAAELRSGAGLRAALEAAAARSPGLDLGRARRLARSGRPQPEVAAALAPALPVNGRLAAVALRMAGSTGGRVADLFDRLAWLALEENELARERRAASAQARASATIVGGLPVVFVLYLIGSGRAGILVEGGPVGVGLLTIGVSLLAAGTGVTVWLLRRADR